MIKMPLRLTPRMARRRCQYSTIPGRNRFRCWRFARPSLQSGDYFSEAHRRLPAMAGLSAQLLKTFVERKMADYLWNSFVIASGTTPVRIALGTGAAYAPSFTQNRATNIAILAALVFQALPTSLMVTPLFTEFKAIGLLSSPRFAVGVTLIANTLRHANPRSIHTDATAHRRRSDGRCLEMTNQIVTSSRGAAESVWLATRQYS